MRRLLLTPTATYTYTYGDSNWKDKLTSYNGNAITYDALNQLVREDNAWINRTGIYTYDSGGNVETFNEYTYTTGSVDGATVTTVLDFKYEDSNWKDKLTGFNGTILTYDAIGNMLKHYTGFTFEWQNGRQLAGVTGNNQTISYTYNADGIRTSKTVNGVTTYYTLEGSNVVMETNGTDTIWYYYDASGSLTGFELNGTPYFYVKNLQGDIVAITNASGTKVVEYTYDAWGRIRSTTGSLASTVGAKNPYRYRGYRYEKEFGLYYLQSRYYDPFLKRFINADNLIADVGGDVLGYNTFAYAFNNPIMYEDSCGNWPQWIEDSANWVKDNLIDPIAGFVNDIVDDINNFDINNQDEQKVLDSNYFSCYKGVLAFRFDGDRSGSFGALFITRETNNRSDAKDIVRHEYGHAVQLRQLGVVKYTLCVFIPSWQMWGSKSYYDKPWEITADIYGGVTSRSPSLNDIVDGFVYLYESKENGISAWKLIK